VWYQYIPVDGKLCLRKTQSVLVAFFQGQWCQVAAPKTFLVVFCKRGVSQYTSIRNSTFSSSIKEKTIFELANIVIQ
jgi:hypothetical protein